MNEIARKESSIHSFNCSFNPHVFDALYKIIGLDNRDQDTVVNKKYKSTSVPM